MANESDPSETPARRSRNPAYGFLRALLLFPAMFVLRSSGCESYLIPSSSMEPTLTAGDRVVTFKSAYGLRIPLTRIPITAIETPERGDIVVFRRPGSVDRDAWTSSVDLPPAFPSDDYVKRVVGLPGEVVEVRGGTVLVDGRPMVRKNKGEHSYLNSDCDRLRANLQEERLGGVRHAVLQEPDPMRRRANWGPKTVPNGHVFVMGDNRDRSNDGRSFGFVPVGDIKGRVGFIWWSMSDCAPKGELPAVRWERLGSGVF